MFVVRSGAVVASGSFSKVRCGGLRGRAGGLRRSTSPPLSHQRAPERPRLLSAGDAAPPVSAARAAVSAEARREAI